MWNQLYLLIKETEIILSFSVRTPAQSFTPTMLDRKEKKIHAVI